MSQLVHAAERMLAHTAGLGVSAEELKDLTEILCPGCDQPLTSDSAWYVTKQGRTMHCCSEDSQCKADK